MPYIYSDPARESDPYSSPDIWVFRATAEEAAEADGELVRSYLKRFPLATMNSREREKMLSAIIEEEGITGGWAWCFGLPGCLPDSDIMGIYATREEAEAAARDFLAE